MPKKLQVHAWCFGGVSLLRMRLSASGYFDPHFIPRRIKLPLHHVVRATKRAYETLVGPWLHKSCLCRMENTLAFASMSAIFFRWTSFARTHMFKATVPQKQQPMNKVFTPTTARALMTVHAGPFYNSHPPVVMLVHGNTRNHVESDLEVKCEMVAQNQTYGLLAAA